MAHATRQAKSSRARFSSDTLVRSAKVILFCYCKAVRCTCRRGAIHAVRTRVPELSCPFFAVREINFANFPPVDLDAPGDSAVRPSTLFPVSPLGSPGNLAAFRHIYRGSVMAGQSDASCKQWSRPDRLTLPELLLIAPCRRMGFQIGAKALEGAVQRNVAIPAWNRIPR